MEQQEIPFSSGESNRNVVKVGDTVRKEPAENCEFVRKVMTELTNNNFNYSPKYLGVDDKGREIMTYVEGEQMNHTEISLDLMKQTFGALRQFHDIFSKSELKGAEETLIHTDFAPWNLIVKDNKLVGVLDFDDVKPGRRISDVAYVCWTFLDIGSTDSNFTEEEVYRYLQDLIKAYGYIDTSDFVDVLLLEQNRILKYREGRVEEVEEGDEKEYRKVLCEEIRKEIEWVKRNRENIDRALGGNNGVDDTRSLEISS
jgi:hypothetical protein